MFQPIVADYTTISQVILDRAIDLIVIDSAAPAAGEPELAGPTTEYFRALRGFERSTLTIAHKAKAGNEDMPFGSTFWRNLPRANFRVMADTEPSDTLLMGVKNTKSNNGPRIGLRGYDFAFLHDPERVEVRTANAADIATVEKDMSVAQRLERALRSGAKKPKELADELETSENTIRGTLYRDTGRFQKLDGGEWGLTAPLFP